MDEKQLQILYNQYAKDKGFNDFNHFKSLMSDDNSRKVFFDHSNKELGFKDYDQFNDILGVKKKDGGIISSPTLLQFQNVVSSLPKYDVQKNISESTRLTSSPQENFITSEIKQASDKNLSDRKSKALDNTINAYSRSLQTDESHPLSKNDPMLLKKKQDIQKMYDEGELMLGKDDKTGNDIFKRKDNGLWSSFINAWDKVASKHQDDKYVSDLSTEDKVKHYELKKMQQDAFLPTEPSGIMGNVGKVVGELAEPLIQAASFGLGAGKLTKAAGFAADVVANANKFGNFFSFANDMGLSGNADNIERVYNSLRQQDPNGDKIEQMKRAENAGLIGSVTGVAEAALMGGALDKFKVAAETVPTQGFMKSMEHIGRNAVKQGSYAAATSVASDLGAKSQGMDIGGEQIAENAIGSFKNMASLTGILEGAGLGLGEIARSKNTAAVLQAMGITAGIIKVPKPIEAQAKGVVSQLPRDEVKKIYEGAEQNNILPQGTTDKVMNELSNFDITDKQVPKDLPEEKRTSLRGIQEKINNLQKSKKELGYPYHEGIDNQIDYLNNQAKKILQYQNPFKIERDEITGERIEPLGKSKNITVIQPEENKPIETTTIAPKEYVPETKEKSITVQLPKPKELTSKEDEGIEKPVIIKGTEVREHAEDTATENGFENGTKPTKLSEEGIQEAKNLGNKIKSEGKTEIVASPVARAQETAKIAAEQAGISNIITNDNFRTLNIGIYDGKPEGSFDEKYWFENPDKAPEDGESVNSFTKRMEKAYQDTKDMPKTTQVIAHSKVLRALQSLKNTDGKWTDETTKEFLRLGEEEKKGKEIEATKNIKGEPTKEKSEIVQISSQEEPQQSAEALQGSYDRLIKNGEDPNDPDMLKMKKNIDELKQKGGQNAIQIRRTTEEIPRPIEQGADIGEGSKGIRSGEQGTEITGEDKQDEGDEEAIGISKAETKKQREERGLGDIDVQDTRGLKEMFESGKKSVDEGSIDPRHLAEVVSKKPRNLHSDEINALLYDRMKIINEHRSVMNEILNAIKNGDIVKESELRERSDKLEKDRINNEKAVKSGARENALALSTMQNMIKDDYSLASQKARAIIANNGETLPKEIISKLEKYDYDLQNAYKKLEEYEKKIGKLSEENEILKAKKEVSEERKKGKAIKKEEIKAERKEIIDRLRAIAKSQMGKLSANPIPIEMVPILGKLVRNLVKDGILELDDIVKNIHDELKEFIEGVTERDVRDAISGYGKPKQLSKNEIERQVREIKRQGRLISSIEDVQSGERPKRSGLNREEDSRKVKELKKELESEMNRMGITLDKKAIDPETEFKTKLESYKKRLQTQLSYYENKIKNNDYTIKERLPIQLDTEGMKLKSNVEEIKAKFDSERKRIERMNAPNLEKRLNFLTAWRRFVVLSNIPTLGKLSAAVAYRSATSFMEEIVGTALRHVPLLNKIAEKAGREGSPLNVSRELRSLRELGSKGTLEDMKKSIKTGNNSLDYIYGGKHIEEPATWLGFFGRVHKALKTPAQRSEYLRSYDIRATKAEEAGIDMSDHKNQFEIGVQAYEDSLRAIFMQENIITKSYNRAIDFLQKSGDKGKSAAAMMKIILPIIKVPTNFVAEASSYEIGALKAAYALRNGISDLTPEQSDYIMRALKKQGIGAAVLALGYFNPQAIGGYYTGKRKSDDLKAGDLIIFGQKMPHWMVHAPFLEMLQLGATIRRARDAGKGWGEGAFEGNVGLIKQIPFTTEPIKAVESLGSLDKFGSYWGDLSKNMVIPPDVQRIARQQDVNEKGELIQRKPTGLIQHIESGIPGLRKNVPTSIQKKQIDEINKRLKGDEYKGKREELINIIMEQ